MFAVCPGCGAFTPEKQIDPIHDTARCPACGHVHPFRRLPLFLLSGASGAGKSTICLELIRRDAPPQDFVVLDSDILWSEEFHAPSQWGKFFNMWLRMCKSINQSGRPVLLAGAGFGVPKNAQACTEARYFSEIHYLALVCDDDLLQTRLQARPQWRANSGHGFIEQQIEYNRWLKESAHRADSPITLLDTTASSVQESAEQVTNWVRRNLPT